MDAVAAVDAAVLGPAYALLGVDFVGEDAVGLEDDVLSKVLAMEVEPR